MDVTTLLVKQFPFYRYKKFMIIRDVICDLPKRVQNHGEEYELSQERDDQGRGGNDLGQQEEEDSQREQNRDRKTDLEEKKTRGYCTSRHHHKVELPPTVDCVAFS